MPLSKLRDFLDRNQIQYLVISHSVAYTAQGIAALTHIKGKELAKTVMIMVDGRLAMAVVPASLRVDLHRVRKYLGAGTVWNWPPNRNFVIVFRIAKPVRCRPSAISTAWTFSRMSRWPTTRKSRLTPARTANWSACASRISRGW